MLGAKLFAIGAVAIALIAFLPIRLTTAIDIYMHDTYFVVGPRHAMLGFALLCGVVAGFYYLGDRIFGHRLSNSLSLSHFLLWIFALIAFWAEGFVLVRTIRTGHDPNQSWPILAAAGAVAISFLAGGLLFLTNFTLAITHRVRRS